MKRKCPYCQSQSDHHSKHGTFTRTFDKKRIARFKCRLCAKTFSEASFHACYRQKKRRLNGRIAEMLCSNVSQRRISKVLKIHRITVARKLVFLGQQAQIKNQKLREALPPVMEMQFDDLETIEHTKCKPLSVTMAVEKKSRRILGFRVSRMPAKGHLVRLSLKKYGYRKDERSEGREELFKEIAPHVEKTAIICSDQNPHYIRDIKKWFPQSTYIRVPGQRGCVAGQGELKRVCFDPLFSLNHSFAMLRANINRLIRRTWCTTKRPDRLALHIELYVNYHNTKLIA